MLVEDSPTPKEHPLRVTHQPLSSLELVMLTEESPVQTWCSNTESKMNSYPSLSRRTDT